MTTKPETLRRNNIFVKCYKKGNPVVSRLFAVYVIKNYDRNKTLYGITVGKKVGNAVVRNRVKRVIRHAYRELFPMLKNGYVIVIVARTSCAEAKSTSACEELYAAFKKKGIIL